MTKRREPSQLARDRRRIADLYLKGWLQADIATETGVDQSTVSRDLKTLQDEWLAAARADFDAAKAQELAKVDRLEREYWDAWGRSCKIAETETTESADDGSGAPARIKAQIRKEGQVGDPRFLTGVQWCIERRCKILGIDAPVRADVTTGGQPVSFQVIEVVKDYGEQGAGG
jgi:hypothetical protein